MYFQVQPSSKGSKHKITKKEISKITGLYSSHIKNSTSFSTTTTNTSQIKYNNSKNNSKIQKTNQRIFSPQNIIKKQSNLELLSNSNRELNDTQLEDLLDMEGHKMIDKLTNTIKITNQGKIILNTKPLLNITTFDNKEFLSNLINNKINRPSRVNSNDNLKNNEKPIFRKKVSQIQSKPISKDIIQDVKKKPYINNKINKEDIVNFLMQAVENKHNYVHNRINSHFITNSARSHLSPTNSSQNLNQKKLKSTSSKRSFKARN